MLGARLTLDCDPPAQFTGQPMCTVSQSEAGFEKIMQAVTVQVSWLVPGEHCTLHLTLDLSEYSPS